jgi:hypothetical protein
MIHIAPPKILAIGLILILTGIALPFLMVIRTLESTLLLNLLAFVSQVVGIFTGTIGMIFYVNLKKH